MALQLLHVTDLHLCGKADARLHGWRVRQAFETVLEAALARYPDFDALVLGGDLVDDETLAGYRYLDTCLQPLQRPVLAIAGNHDDPRGMARSLRHARVHQAMPLGRWTLIGLDSHVDGHDSGRLGEAQVARLAEKLAVTSGPVLLFVHHPPCALGSAWIDGIGLIDAELLARALAENRNVKALVCGHAHQAAHQCIEGVDCWVTPSTMRQFLPGARVFAEDRQRAPGYRWLGLSDDGTIVTRVHRVPEARKALG